MKISLYLLARRRIWFFFAVSGTKLLEWICSPFHVTPLFTDICKRSSELNIPVAFVDVYNAFVVSTVSLATKMISSP